MPVQRLPQFQSDDRVFQMMQSRWATILEPLTTNPSLQSNILTNVVLATGSNTINHLLGRKLQGWRLIRVRAAATIYDEQDTNQNTAQTLILNASAPVTIDLEIF